MWLPALAPWRRVDQALPETRAADRGVSYIGHLGTSRRPTQSGVAGHSKIESRSPRFLTRSRCCRALAPASRSRSGRPSPIRPYKAAIHEFCPRPGYRLRGHGPRPGSRSWPGNWPSNALGVAPSRGVVLSWVFSEGLLGLVERGGRREDACIRQDLLL